MTDKLYSRKRIHIPKLKKISIFKLYILLIVLFIVSIVGFFLYNAFPIFKASCESAAGAYAAFITNESITEVMENYNYNDFVNIYEDNGKIKMLEANVVTMNKVISKIISSIQNKINGAPRTNVFINMGSITGVSFLECIGPKFEIELETAGRINSKVRTEFEGAGINQTLHKIYVDLDTNIGILTPYGSFSRNFVTTVLLTQTIIVGEIPETYYDFNGSYTDEEDVAMEAM